MKIERPLKPFPAPSLIFVLLLGLFSSLVLAGGFLLQGSLYWDTSRIFPQFRDNLHSLNTFGEIAWWLPHNQMGSPGYYHSILGIPSCLTPVFVGLGFLCFLLGKMGIHFHTYHALYVLYFGFIIPILFLFALHSLLRHLFNDGRVIRWVLILAAFSPGITFNLSDVGYLEPTIYSLFFATCVLNFLEKKSGQRALLLYFSCLCLGLCFNHAFLYWNLFAIPCFLFLVWWKKGKPTPLSVMRNALVYTALLYFMIGALPNLITQTQGKDLIRSSLGMSKSYPVEKLAAGNPIEMLSISTPGFGYDWDSSREHWSLIPFSTKYHAAYQYMGGLTLPLVLLAFLYANLFVRITLFIFAIIYFGILPLSAHSPFFAPILSLPSPLQSCNHFSDAGFKAGNYLFLLIAAGFGFQLVTQGRRKRELCYLFGLSTLMAIAAHFFWFGKGVLDSLSFGVLLFGSLLFGLTLINLAHSKNRLRTQIFVSVVVLLSLFDVATHSFLWIRNVLGSELILNSGWRATSRINETPAETQIGMRNGSDTHFYANTLLILKPYYEMLLEHFNTYSLPPLKLYYETHLQRSLREELSVYAGNSVNPSLPLAVHYSLPNAELEKLDIREEIQVTHRSYSTLDLEVSAPKSALLFIRDAYSPYWRANVDGSEITVLRAFYNFKAIPIAPGKHFINLSFRPPWVGTTILIAYLTLIGIVFALLLSQFSLRNRIDSPATSPA